MTAKNPYAPPLAELDVHGASHGMACQVRYRLGRFDYFTWNIVHQLRLIPLQVICVAPAIALALQVKSYSLSIATGLLAYVLLWSTQIAFLVIVIYTGRNKHLLTEHTVELQADAFFVATEYGRQYHYWRGIQRVLDGPGFLAVYTNSHAAHIIPDRAFTSHALRSQFVSVLRARRLDACNRTVKGRRD